MEIVILDSPKEVDEFVASQIVDLVKTKERPVVGFATGSTPVGAYNLMIEQYHLGKVDFSNLIAFNLDEYVGVKLDHPRSFATFMRTRLFDQINVKKENIYALDGSKQDLTQVCNEYEKLIENNQIDIQILGVGMNGHIGYNEPGSDLDGKTHVVDLQEKSITSSLNYGFTKIEEVPTKGITMGIGTIMKAKKLLMIAKGKDKKDIVKAMLEEPISSKIPSTIIRQHDNVIVILDKEAAGK